jgi:oxidase EvaA
MISKELDFIISALTEHNPFMNTQNFMDWFVSQQQRHAFEVCQIPFKELEKWVFDSVRGDLEHVTGKFFSITGIKVETNVGNVSQWSQPIILQPEIGILGILTKKVDGILYFLMQAKMEPGNINTLQLAPTIQATRSNYTCVHGGNMPPYLDFFQKTSNSTVLVDTLQSEQGARFLRKRNRNIIIRTTRKVPLLENFCWLTLSQIQRLCRLDNVVNMDARSVLSCIQFAGQGTQDLGIAGLAEHIKRVGFIDSGCIGSDFSDFGAGIVRSALDTSRSLYDMDELISWFTALKIRYTLEVERIPLKSVKKWHKTSYEILHEEGNYFSVIAVAVNAENREAVSWTQPIIKPQRSGIIAFIVKKINGILHFLIQAKVEPGNFDIIEMAPTVQCITGKYMNQHPEHNPPFLEYVLNAPSDQVRLSTFQSEEGGRFFHEQNRNMLIEVGENFPLKIPDNYIWMTMNQIKQFIKFNYYVNVQSRCLLSCIEFRYTSQCKEDLSNT